VVSVVWPGRLEDAAADGEEMRAVEEKLTCWLSCKVGLVMHDPSSNMQAHSGLVESIGQVRIMRRQRVYVYICQ
jgi:hypothetical protein